MIDREPNRRTNDSLQSGEGDVALGENEREFGNRRSDGPTAAERQ